MKIAVISDIHDNLANLERFLKLAEELKIEGIICCGDVTTPETLEKLVSDFSGPIKLACGNMEIRREEFAEVAERHKNLEVFAELGEWALRQGFDGELSRTAQGKIISIAFVHRPGKTEGLALSGKYNLIFHGHTHRPWIKGGESLETVIANPGTLGGVFTTPTFAILNTETQGLELKKLYG